MDVSSPQQPSYATQMSDTLLAQEQAQTGTGQFASLGPMINLESDPLYGQPAWANLSLQTINSLLNGRPASSAVENVPGAPTQAGWYDKSGNLVSTNKNYTPPAVGGFMGGAGNVNGSGGYGQPAKPQGLGYEWRDSTTPTTQQTVNTPATPGLLGIADVVAQKQADLNARALTQQRTSDINDIMRLGPQAMTALNQADPGSAAIIAQMTGQAQNGLNLGTNLSPAQTRTATQGVLSANQGMLGGTGNAGDFALALGLTQYGQQLQQNRWNYANNALGARQNFYGNPFATVLGRTSTTNPQSYIGQAQGISAGSYNPYQPESQYAANINASNQQSSFAGSAASAQATSGLISGIMGGLGSAVGSL